MSILSFLQSAGIRPPAKLPAGVVIGDIRFQATYDYDAAAATNTMMNFRAVSSALVDVGVASVVSTASDNPDLWLAMEAISLDFLDEAAYEHADPEDIIKAWDQIYLKVDDGDRAVKYELGQACGFPLEHLTSGGNGATAEAALSHFGRSSRWLTFPQPIYVNLKSVQTLALEHAATGSLLSADSLVNVYVRGAIWDADMHPIPGSTIKRACTDEKGLAAGSRVPRSPVKIQG